MFKKDGLRSTVHRKESFDSPESCTNIISEYALRLLGKLHQLLFQQMKILKV